MTKEFKPLLSATIDPMKDPEVFGKIKFGDGLYLSPKLDGIRSVVRGGNVVSRKLLLIPRQEVQDSYNMMEHLDGEMLVGNPTAFDVYNKTNSYVMSNDKRDPVELGFYVFDWACEAHASLPFETRLDKLQFEVQQWRECSPGMPTVHVVPQTLVRSIDDMLEAEQTYLGMGYEGVMLRSRSGTYKWGRSTFNEHTLMKLKRFEDFEAEIVDFEEAMTNTNAAEKDELGHTKRSSAKAGMVPANTLGNLIVLYQGERCLLPPGTLNHKQRKHIWDNKEQFVGKFAKGRHFPHGAKDGLRLPRCVGLRDPADM